MARMPVFLTHSWVPFSLTKTPSSHAMKPFGRETGSSGLISTIWLRDLEWAKRSFSFNSPRVYHGSGRIWAHGEGGRCWLELSSFWRRIQSLFGFGAGLLEWYLWQWRRAVVIKFRILGIAHMMMLWFWPLSILELSFKLSVFFGFIVRRGFSCCCWAVPIRRQFS